MNRIFERIVCINLDRRPDRWALMQQRFAEQGIAAERVAASEGPDAVDPEIMEPYWGRKRARIGCATSHLSVVRSARESGADSVFVFEDDVCFAPRFRETFAQWVDELPGDWEMLLLGGLHHAEPGAAGLREFAERVAPLPVSRHVHRLRASYCLHAYALRHTLFEAALAFDPLIVGPIDNVYMRHFQRRGRCYGLMPAREARPGIWGLVRQDPGISSDIREACDRIDWDGSSW